MQVYGFIILAVIAAGAWWRITATLEDNWRAEQAQLAIEQAAQDERTAESLEAEARDDLSIILADTVRRHRLVADLPKTEEEPTLCPVDCLLPPLQ